MLFKRMEKYEEIPVSNRKIAAAKRSIQRNKEKLEYQYALFPELQKIEETVEERIAKYKVVSEEYKQRNRDYEAQQWRRGRQILRSLPSNLKNEVEQVWNAGNEAKTALNFVSTLWSELANKYRICPDCADKIFGHRTTLKEYVWCNGSLWEWWIGFNDWIRIAPQKARQKQCELCDSKFYHFTVKKWEEKTEQLDLLEATNA